MLVDDSMICRHQLTEILQADGLIEVVAEGSRGEEALALIEQHRPDMLVVDLVMPGQGGHETISLVMAKHPLPILVVTAQPEGVRQTAVFDAIRRGALDLAEKPRRGDRDAEERLRRSIRTLAHIPVVRHVAGNLTGPQRPVAAARPERSSERRLASRDRQQPTYSSRPPHRRSDPTEVGEPSRATSDAPAQGAVTPSDAPSDGVLIVGIGASAGGPTPLAALLAALPNSFSAAVAVVQHLPIGFMDAFVEYLRGRIGLTVKKVEGRETLRPGVVYLPADDRHLVALAGGYIATSQSPALEGHRPAVDVLFDSLARVHGRRSMGVILSGIGQDGVRGLLAMRDQGALTMAQSEESCAVFGMPQAALKFEAARLSLPPEDLARELQRHTSVQTPWRVAR